MTSEEGVKFSKDDLWMYETIARGGYGYVVRAEDKTNGLDLAIKCFINNEDCSKLKREAEKMSKLKHESIVRIYGMVENDSFAGVAMEYMAGGNIVEAKESLLSAGKILPVEIMNQWNYEIAEGIKYIHGVDIVHKDIKARNCLVDGHFHAKLCDFELCRGVQTTTVTLNLMESPKATPTHMCPQCIRDTTNAGKYEPRCDIYAFGIFMFEVYSKDSQPFEDQFMQSQALLNNAVDKNNLRPNINLINGVAPPEMIALMVKCWDENPDARPKAQEIVRELYNVFEPQQEKAKQAAVQLTPHVLRKKTSNEGKKFEKVRPHFLRDGGNRAAPVSNDPADRIWKHLSTEEAENVLNLKNCGFNLGQKEQTVVSDDCINAIGKQIGPNDFKNIGRCFLFTDPELDGFHHDYQNQGGIAEVNTKMLKRWKEARDSDATYKWLATACLSLGRNDLINLIIKMPA